MSCTESFNNSECDHSLYKVAFLFSLMILMYTRILISMMIIDKFRRR